MARTGKPPAASHVSVAVSRPPDQAVPNAPVVAPPASTATTEAALPVKTEPGLGDRSGERFCQLGALDTEQGARREWQHLQARMPELLSGRTPTIMSADVHGRTFWRLRTGGFQQCGPAKHVLLAGAWARAGLLVIPVRGTVGHMWGRAAPVRCAGGRAGGRAGESPAWQPDGRPNGHTVTMLPPGSCAFDPTQPTCRDEADGC